MVGRLVSFVTQGIMGFFGGSRNQRSCERILQPGIAMCYILFLRREEGRKDTCKEKIAVNDPASSFFFFL